MAINVVSTALSVLARHQHHRSSSFISELCRAKPAITINACCLSEDNTERRLEAGSNTDHRLSLLNDVINDQLNFE